MFGASEILWRDTIGRNLDSPRHVIELTFYSIPLQLFVTAQHKFLPRALHPYHPTMGPRGQITVLRHLSHSIRCLCVVPDRTFTSDLRTRIPVANRSPLHSPFYYLSLLDGFTEDSLLHNYAFITLCKYFRKNTEKVDC